MNKQQRAYAVAKAQVETLDDLQAKREAEFIRESGYRNPDGTIPAKLWLIDDENEFIQLNEAWEASPLNLFEDVRKAAAELTKAEDALIDYALSLVPGKARKTLNAHRRDYSIRQKMIDLAFRLDTRTVSA